MDAPIRTEDWNWLVNRPRLLRVWNAQTEGSVAALMISCLQLAEEAPDHMLVPLELSLRDLRNHVQWCQIAGNVLETAIPAQSYFLRLEHHIRSLDMHIRSLEHLLMSAGVDPPLKPRMRTHAKTPS